MKLTYSNRIKIALCSLVLFLLSTMLLHHTSKDKTLIEYSYKIVYEILYPFQNFTNSSINFVHNAYDNYVNLVNLKSENEKLKFKIAKLKKRNLKLNEEKRENKSLKRLLKIKRKTKLSSIGAEIIGYNPAKWGHMLLINRGSNDSVAVGDPVISHEGVVGQVVSASPHTARVLVLIDRISATHVFLHQSRARGVLVGGGKELCELKYILKNSDVKIGDKVLTSGLDGVFPKGLLVGYIADISPTSSSLFSAIKVKPAVNFSKLEFVIVLKTKLNTKLKKEIKNEIKKEEKKEKNNL
ncbi:MAG: rod shape-determining protein MreC [Bdellovibrionota bacterium]